jgi:hypothetical protein
MRPHWCILFLLHTKVILLNIFYGFFASNFADCWIPDDSLVYDTYNSPAGLVVVSSMHYTTAGNYTVLLQLYFNTDYTTRISLLEM